MKGVKEEKKVSQRISLDSSLRYLRYSAKKMKFVAKVYQGMQATRALSMLAYAQSKGAKLLYKAVKSAVSNAVNNHWLNESSITVDKILSNDGIRIQRVRIRGKGSSDEMTRPTMHIYVTVSGLLDPKRKTSTTDHKEKVKDFVADAEVSESKPTDATSHKLETKSKPKQVVTKQANVKLKKQSSSGDK